MDPFPTHVDHMGPWDRAGRPVERGAAAASRESIFRHQIWEIGRTLFPFDLDNEVS